MFGLFALSSWMSLPRTIDRAEGVRGLFYRSWGDVVLVAAAFLQRLTRLRPFMGVGALERAPRAVSLLF